MLHESISNDLLDQAIEDAADDVASWCRSRGRMAAARRGSDAWNADFELGAELLQRICIVARRAGRTGLELIDIITAGRRAVQPRVPAGASLLQRQAAFTAAQDAETIAIQDLNAARQRHTVAVMARRAAEAEYLAHAASPLSIDPASPLSVDPASPRAGGDA